MLVPRVGRAGSSLVSQTHLASARRYVQLRACPRDVAEALAGGEEDLVARPVVALALAQAELYRLGTAQGDGEAQGGLERRAEGPGRERGVEGQGQHLGDAALAERDAGGGEDAAVEEVVLREARLDSFAAVQGGEHHARAAHEMPGARETAQGQAGAVAPDRLVLQVQRLVEREGADPVVEEEPPGGLGVDGQLVGAPLAPLAQGEARVQHERQALHAVDGLAELASVYVSPSRNRVSARTMLAAASFGPSTVIRSIRKRAGSSRARAGGTARRRKARLQRVRVLTCGVLTCENLQRRARAANGAWLQPHLKGKADAVPLLQGTDAPMSLLRAVCRTEGVWKSIHRRGV